MQVNTSVQLDSGLRQDCTDPTKFKVRAHPVMPDLTPALVSLSYISLHYTNIGILAYYYIRILAYCR